MDKKLQLSRNACESKNYGPKWRTKEFVNEKIPAQYQNTRNISNSWNYCPKNTHKNTSKSHRNCSQSASLSNEDYIMASAQIWVNQDIDYYDNVFNNWSDIIQINFYGNEEMKCPICLGAPVAPRTDRCGHIYCLPCLKLFLSYNMEFKNNCALCGQQIDISRVKRAGIIQSLPLEPGNSISFVLIKRDKCTSFPLPMNSQLTSMPIANSRESQFSNVAICLNEDLLSILQMEIMTLEEEISSDNDDRTYVLLECLEGVRNEFEILSTIIGAGMQQQGSVMTHESIKADMVTAAMKSGSVYYQAEGANNVFMSPVNWRCMATEFIDKGLCLPMRVDATVVEVERFSVNEEFSGRYRYLRGLPSGCTATFVELDLGDVVSDSTMERHRTLLNGRAATRLERLRIDEELSKKKVRNERVMINGDDVVRLGSLMHETSLVTCERDFMPLCPSVNNAPVAIINDISGVRRTFSEVTTARAVGPRDNATSNVVAVNVEEGTPNRGFSLEDCVVVKEIRRKKRR